MALERRGVETVGLEEGIRKEMRVGLQVRTGVVLGAMGEARRTDTTVISGKLWVVEEARCRFFTLVVVHGACSPAMTKLKIKKQEADCIKPYDRCVYISCVSNCTFTYPLVLQ